VQRGRQAWVEHSTADGHGCGAGVGPVSYTMELLKAQRVVDQPPRAATPSVRLVSAHWLSVFGEYRSTEVPPPTPCPARVPGLMRLLVLLLTVVFPIGLTALCTVGVGLHRSQCNHPWGRVFPPWRGGPRRRGGQRASCIARTWNDRACGAHASHVDVTWHPTGRAWASNRQHPPPTAPYAGHPAWDVEQAA
jgi:hypothetical protein